MHTCLYSLDWHVDLNIINSVQSITWVLEQKGVQQRFIQNTVYSVYVNQTGIDCVTSK